LEKFDSYINEDTWKERFEVDMQTYLVKVADANLKVFMEQGSGVNLSNSGVVNTNSPLKNQTAAPKD